MKCNHKIKTETPLCFFKCIDWLTLMTSLEQNVRGIGDAKDQRSHLLSVGLKYWSCKRRVMLGTRIFFENTLKFRSNIRRKGKFGKKGEGFKFVFVPFLSFEGNILS